jgi:hypothetical protein
MTLTLTSWADPMAEGGIVWEVTALWCPEPKPGHIGLPIYDAAYDALTSALADGWEPFAVTASPGGGSFYMHLRRPQSSR